MTARRPRSSGTIPNNLPGQPTRFVGREQVIRQVRRQLRQEDVQLLTLTGPGGIGKTRLALQVASGLLASYPDGVFFVALGALTDPALVPSAIVQVLSSQTSPDRSALSTLTHLLRDKAMLLILDNFEHLPEAAGDIAQLMAACPRLKLLVTSRAVLNLYGEHSLAVPPLSLPAARAPMTADAASSFESVRLFVERAGAGQPDFALDDANAAAVVEICRRLDGLPLAIELAAARLRALPLPTLLERMERRLPLLTGGPRDAPARQQTLRAAITWSYDLLDERERTLFRRLAVFRGCTLDAIQTVCCAASAAPQSTSVAVVPLDLDPLDGASSLVEKSLLRYEVMADGQVWYAMLETIRELALERLAESDEADTVHRRHVGYYLNLAEAAEPELTGPNQAIWFGRLEREHDNVRAAIRWCEQKRYAEPALRLSLALWWFWSVHGHLGEGRDILTGLLERFRPRDASQRHLALRARALQAAGYLAEFQRDYQPARVAQEEALHLFRGLGDAVGVESALHALGNVALLQDDLQAAHQYIESAHDMATARNDPWSVSAALASLADVTHRQGDLANARALMERAIETKRGVASLRDLAFHMLNLSGFLEEQGDYDGARALYDQSLEQYRQNGDQRTVGITLVRLGSLDTVQGRYDAARQALDESLAVFEDLGDLGGVALSLEGMATLAVAQSRPVRGLRLAGAASVLRSSLDASPLLGSPAGLDQTLQAARQVLGEAAADAAWASGCALSPADAVAEARATAEPETSSTGRGAQSPRLRAVPTGVALTARECEVAGLIARGLTNRQIATELVIAEGTVANHVVNILNRLGVGSRAQVAVWAAEHGLLA
jgi:non-specific serine/threonine protein kinase